MSTTHRKRWVALGAAFGAGVAAVVVSALAAFASSGAAASQAKPVNTSPPTISGTPQQGQTLHGDRGEWTNNPTDYNWYWYRCNANGGGCSRVGSADGQHDYAVGSADGGNTIRLKIRATNSDGSNDALSAPTPVIPKAATLAKPVNTGLPTISGTPQAGQTLQGNRGQWSNSPTDYNWYWYRCNASGGGCDQVTSAGGQDHYNLSSADVGNTIRLKIRATNGRGSTEALSAPTAVIQKAPAPSRGAGCPPGGNPDQVANIQGPANLIIDAFVSTPNVVTRGTTAWTLRVHVTSSCGGPVQGAMVYGTATPFNQFTIPAEQPTGADGYATLTFQRLSGFPVSNHQELIAMFLRARKPGENVLNGITGYRLVSVPVDLNR